MVKPQFEIGKPYRISNAVCNTAGRIFKSAALVALGAFGIQLIAAGCMDIFKKKR